MNLNNIISGVSKLSSPNQVRDYALGLLEKKNPSAARNIRSMIQSGKNPADVLRSYAQSGKISSSTLATAKRAYNVARKSGLKIQIPQGVWDTAEQAIRGNTANSDWF